MTRPPYLDAPAKAANRLGMRTAKVDKRRIAFAQFDIKMFADGEALEEDATFTFAIPADLNGSKLTRAEAYVTAAGSTDVEVAVENLTQAAAMLTSSIVIDDGELTSYTSASPSAADDTVIVETGDLIEVKVADPGTDAEGLGVILDFS